MTNSIHSHALTEAPALLDPSDISWTGGPASRSFGSPRLTRRGALVGALAGVAALGCAPSRNRAVDCRHDAIGGRDSDLRVAPLSSGAEPPEPRAVCAATEDNIEGPFFKHGAPERNVLASPGTRGTRLLLVGRVLGIDCRPVVGCRLDVWHADHAGAYDQVGYAFRAAVETDALGGFSFLTIVPGRYLNGARHRPAHIHAKLSAPGHRPLTTQLYFAGDPYNEGDPFIRPSLIMTPFDTPAGKAAAFDFVLPTR
jgi:protocatechuate 3,4-dioxygenase beta subunit